MTEVVKKLLIANPDSSIMNNLCRLCGRYNWNMTSIFDVNNRYDYSKVINLHFRGFNISEYDDLPLKLCIQCVATVTAWHEYYNSCRDVNKRLKTLKSKLVTRHNQDSVNDSNNEESFIIPDVLTDNASDTSHMMLSNNVPFAVSKNLTCQIEPDAESRSELPRELPLEVDLTTDDSHTVDVKHSHEDSQLDEFKPFEDENFERNEVNSPGEAEVIEIKVDDEDDKEVEANDLYDDSSCPEDEFDNIENIRIQDDASSLTSSQSDSNPTVKDKALDTEEIAILPNDLNTVGKDTIAENQSRKTVEQLPKNDKTNKSKKSSICHICGKVYATKISYLRHLLKEHSSPSSTKPSRAPMSAKSGVPTATNENPLRESSSCDKRACLEEEDQTEPILESNDSNEVSNPEVNETENNPTAPPTKKKYPSAKNRLRICHLCGKHYNTSSGFRHHMVMHRDPTFSCHLCGRVFHESQNLKKHMNTIHSEERPFQCHLCGMNYKRRDVLQEHIRRVHEGYRKQWSEEMIKRHGEKLKQKPEKRFQCPHCNKCMASKAYLNDHINGIHTKEKIYQCKECDMSFCRQQSYRYHYKRAHIEKKEVLEPRGTFSKECEYCGLQFLIKKYYEIHVATKHFNKYTCKHCDQVFDNKFHLTKHTESEHADQLYKCEVCGKLFAEEVRVKRHVYMIHTKRTPFECYHCGYKANKKSTIEGHMRKHTGEKPYQCDVCQRCFSQVVDYRKHRANHFKVQPEERVVQVRDSDFGYILQSLDVTPEITDGFESIQP